MHSFVLGTAKLSLWVTPASSTNVTGAFSPSTSRVALSCAAFHTYVMGVRPFGPMMSRRVSTSVSPASGLRSSYTKAKVFATSPPSGSVYAAVGS
jgi:hypothetical protein